MTGAKLVNSKGTLATRLVAVFGLLLCSAPGCGGNSEEKRAADAHHGYHGGHTFKMPSGTPMQLELTVDEKQRRMVVYCQSASSHQPLGIAAETLKAKFESSSVEFDTAFTADPRKSDGDGQSSRYALGLDKLPQQLASADRFVLTIWYPAEGEVHEVSIIHRNDHSHEYHHD